MGGEIFGSVGVNSYFAVGPKVWVLARIAYCVITA